MTGKYYYLGKNGLEYATFDDADNKKAGYGGGCVGKRFHNPVKQWEPVYENMESTTVATPTAAQVVPENYVAPLNQIPESVETPLVDTPQNVTEYDAMDLPQLKKVLADKGYQIKGNLKRETIIEKLKSLKPL